MENIKTTAELIACDEVKIRIDEQKHIIEQLSRLPKGTSLEVAIASLRTKMRIENLQVKEPK